MTDEEETALVKRLPKGSRRALLAMTTVPTLPGRATFNANAAFNLTWFSRAYGGLATSVRRERRDAYSLTPLGERIRDRLLASAGEAGTATTPKSGVVHEHATAESGDVPKESQ